MEKHTNAEEKAKREQKQEDIKKRIKISFICIKYKMFGLFESKPAGYNTSNSRLKLKYNKEPLTGGKRRRTRRKKASKKGTRRGGRR